MFSVCGYDTMARQQGKKKVQDPPEYEQATSTPSTPTKAAQRRAAYHFTGCLAHADITYAGGHRLIVRVIGYFEHNLACQNASLVRFPRIPIHPHVFELAIKQLRCGARCVHCCIG